MGLISIIRKWFRRENPEAVTETEPNPEKVRLTKNFKKCGKPFPYDTSWENIPNYCRDCRKSFVQ